MFRDIWGSKKKKKNHSKLRSKAGSTAQMYLPICEDMLVYELVLFFV